MATAMLARNALFLAVCLIGTTLVASTLLRQNLSEVEGPDAAARRGLPTQEWDLTLERLNDEFEGHWQAQNLTPTPAASDLTLARRISLALVGTAPSLEEIRALEALPEGERISWWTNHLLADRRFSDYWAERLARIYVGNDQGP